MKANYIAVTIGESGATAGDSLTLVPEDDFLSRLAKIQQ
jgi:hypothetical protein